MRVKEAVILAGGLGTRLKSVVRDLPKPMADVSGRPFLSYLLEYLSSHGINKVVLSVGFRREAIMECFGGGHSGVAIEYAVEDRPLGTGGGLREALKLCRGENVFALNGDSFFGVNLGSMEFFHVTGGPLLTMAVKPVVEIARFGSIRVEDARVAGFEEKKTGPGFINGGVYIINRRILGALDGFKESFSFESDFLKLNSGSILPFVSDSYFIDIGIPEDYAKARFELAGRFERLLKRPNRPHGQKAVPAQGPDAAKIQREG
ncbi:MAG: nucleotidyltransferase family protein [Deltaproteobacteria bacterium]|nr:nucleotidyltransferase family protein [Deltaproteobacteria bacterium]